MMAFDQDGTNEGNLKFGQFWSQRKAYWKPPATISSILAQGYPNPQNIGVKD